MGSLLLGVLVGEVTQMSVAEVIDSTRGRGWIK